MENTSSRSLLGTVETPLTEPTNDERLLAILAHVLTLVGSFIPPLVIYLLKNKESSYVADHARESLNFQITMIIAMIVSSLLIILLIGLLFIWVLGILDVIWVVVAAVRASENKLYRYPFNLRLIK
jgi:uncharacterized protein